MYQAGRESLASYRHIAALGGWPRIPEGAAIKVGATDPRVPVGEALQMFEVMQTKKLGAEMIVFPDEGHGVQKRENAVLMLGHALAFFEKHLK